MKTKRGFTLMELMIVVVIVGILMAIAMPSYTDYVIRGKIPDATTNLSTKRTQLEQYFQDNRTYVGAPACTADTTTSQHFNFSCSVAPTATVFTLQAAGKAGMAAFVYTLDQNGTKTSTIDATAATGWEAASASCWITNKGGAC
jgi:type IV pilus assembly protein PilE